MHLLSVGQTTKTDAISPSLVLLPVLCRGLSFLYRARLYLCANSLLGGQEEGQTVLDLAVLAFNSHPEEHGRNTIRHNTLGVHGSSAVPLGVVRVELVPDVLAEVGGHFAAKVSGEVVVVKVPLIVVAPGAVCGSRCEGAEREERSSNGGEKHSDG